MSGNKTHRQHRRILEKQVDTGNAGKDFDPRPDLKRAEAGLPPQPAASGGPAGKNSGNPAHQESPHNKHRGTPDRKDA